MGPSSDKTGQARRDKDLVLCAVLGCAAIALVTGLLLHSRAQQKHRAQQDELIATANAKAAEAMSQIRVFKTNVGAEASSQSADYRQRALDTARKAHEVIDTPKTSGTLALMEVYDARLNSGLDNICDKYGGELDRLGPVTRDLVDHDEVSAEGYFARAIWTFKECHCHSDWERSAYASECDEADGRFADAYQSLPTAADDDWLRFEVIWQRQMHLLVYGNLLKKSGDRKGRDLLETSMSYCEVGEAFANAAPVNDVELYKNCARAAAALERWDEMAYYNTKLADFEPEQGGRSRIGALAALSRMAAFRDPTCEEIPPYQSLSKRKSGVWFGGYPGARRGYPIDHFCIGWAYAQLGCEREATKELDQYLRSGHDLHEEEARTLRAELAQDRAPCLVPDAR